MSLENLLQKGKAVKKIGVSEERVEAIKPILRQYIAFWREYPDLFVDFMQAGYNAEREAKVKAVFDLFFYQRVFLRVTSRFKYVYCVYPRAYSKSFLSVLTQMIRCILFPGAHLFSSAGGKEQAAQILQDKVREICDKIPAFAKEIDWRRGQTQEGKDHCKYIFKNGSDFENIAARESSRGRRKQGGLLEECVGLDQQILQEVLIPLMNVSRRCLDGTVQEDEVLNQSQLYITTAGYKGTYAYEKLIQTLVQMIIQPDKAYIMGGTYRVPILMGLLPRSFLNDLKRDTTFNEASFEREYESKWTGDVEDAFFSGEKFDRNRTIKQPEYEFSKRSGSRAFYIISVDVGRKDCATVATVLKVTPQPMGSAIKSVVAIYSRTASHFREQAVWLKKLFYKYKARRLIIDANGLGVGLMDEMVISQDFGDDEYYPPFGVYGGTYADADQEYRKFRTDDTEDDAIYAIKANAPINSEAYSTTKAQLDAGKIKFLISERDAKNKLLGTKMGQAMTPEQRNNYLAAYTLTDILKEELLNLREKTGTGLNIILEQVNKNVKKDKVSALIYGIYYLREEEENKRRKRASISDFMFLN